MKRILLRTQAGFCNRLRAIVSGILWAEDLGAKLCLYSPIELGVFANHLGDVLEVDSIPRVESVQTSFLSKAHSVQSVEEMKAVLQLYRGCDQICIESYSNFHPQAASVRGTVVLRQIRLQPEIQKAADVAWKNMGGSSDWLGVHFRGKDHSKCLQKAPLSEFLRQLDVEISHSGATVFLATDEEGAKREILAKYGGERVKTLDGPLGRFTQAQQFSGILDWALLQKCKRVIYSDGSSFSETAVARSGAFASPINVGGEAKKPLNLD